MKNLIISRALKDESLYIRAFLKEGRSLKEIEDLLDQEPRLVDYIDRNGDTLVTVATENADLELLKSLVERKVDLNVINTSCQTPLIIAVISRLPDVMEFLLENRADVNKRNDRLRTDRYKYTPLLYAVNIGFKQGVEILLKYNAKVNEVDYDWYTPIMIAAVLGDVDILSLLLDNPEIQLDSKDVYGFTALMHAMDNRHIEVVRRLVEKGADIYGKNNIKELSKSNKFKTLDEEILLEFNEAEPPEVEQLAIEEPKEFKKMTQTISKFLESLKGELDEIALQNKHEKTLTIKKIKHISSQESEEILSSSSSGRSATWSHALKREGSVRKGRGQKESDSNELSRT